MIKRISAAVFLGLLSVVFVTVAVRFASGGWRSFSFGLESMKNGDLARQTEALVADSLPFHTALHRLGIELRLAAGTLELGGVYSGETMLLKKIEEPDNAVVERNIAAVTQLAEQMESPGSVSYTHLLLGGSGGGRPDSAMGGVSDIFKIDEAFVQVPSMISKMLEAKKSKV